MATLISGNTALDMNNLGFVNFLSAIAFSANATTAQAVYADGSFQLFSGSFVLDGSGHLAGGTINGITEFKSGDTPYVITGLSYPVTSFLAFLNAANGPGLIADMFSGADSITGGIGNDTLSGFDGKDTLAGGKGDDSISGGAGNDALSGDDGNETLDGGSGNDSMDGGNGNDTYIVDSFNDLAAELSGSGNDTVLASADYQLSVGIENLSLTGAALIGSGNELNNVITGNGSNNELYGVEGNDTIAGGDGKDTLAGGEGHDSLLGGGGNDYLGGDFTTGNGNDTLDGGAGADTMEGGKGDDSLSGGLDDDSLFGDDGNDTLDGGAGTDFLDGGKGDDVYLISDTLDAAVEFGTNSGGIDTVVASVDYQLEGAQFGIENLVLKGSAEIGFGNGLNNVITGNAGDNFLFGDDGDDTLDGGGNNGSGFGDFLDGGRGNDLYIINDLYTTASETFVPQNGGIDTVKSSVDYILFLGEGIENLTLVGNAVFGDGNDLDNVITGNDGDNWLTGYDGNDTLNGGVGTDTLRGGAGDDIYIIADDLDFAAEQDQFGDGGTDTVLAGIDYQMEDVELGVENLTLIGSAIYGFGNEGGNVLTGNDLDNGLLAAGGDDTLHGGVGSDTLDGGAGADSIDGGDGEDTLYGDFDAPEGAGNDTLDGGAGADSMNGGLGDDIYVVDDAGDIAHEDDDADGGGSDTVQALVDYQLAAGISSVENLTLIGTAQTGAGNEFNNAVTGNELDNVLSGNAGDDTLNGSDGIDTLIGGDGDDSYVIAGDNNDLLVEDADGGTDTVQSSIGFYALANNIENLVLLSGAGDGEGNELNNHITGNEDGNSLFGLEGNDTIDGGLGADFMDGGLGDDLYLVDDDTDQISEVDGPDAGIDTVRSTAFSYQLSDDIENLILDGEAIYGSGSALNNTITGLDHTNILDGGIGNDTILGLGGQDELYGLEDEDLLDGGDDSDLLNGGSGADTLVAGADNDVLFGEDDNDVLDGGTGADTMLGGLGDDLYLVDDESDLIGELEENGGTDTVHSTSVFFTLGTDIENLTLQDIAWFGGGNELDNIIIGNASENSLDGGDGNDTIQAGDGYDFLNGNAGNDVLDGGAKDDYMTGGADNDSMSGGDDSDTLGGSTGADTLHGDAGNDLLFGEDGDDILDGGTGADNMYGGAGDDIYYVDDALDFVTEYADEGSDTIHSSVSYSLTPFAWYVETLILEGSADINATGDFFDNLLVGNDGNNTFESGGGVDTMAGGAGDDTYIIQSGEVIVENVDEGIDTALVTATEYRLAANVENLIAHADYGVLKGEGNEFNNIMTANDHGVALYGLGGADTIIGGTNADSLIGGAGSDSLTGGAGDDVYGVDGKSDIVIELAGGGRDTVQSSINYELGANFEDLVLLDGATLGKGNSADNLIQGNAGINGLFGAAGNDTLDGGEGADLLVGGAGNDLYVIDHGLDGIVEAAGGGIDTVSSSLSYTLGTNLENLALVGYDALNGTGNGLANLLVGNFGDNWLRGNGGQDTLSGNIGLDTLTGGAGRDVFLRDHFDSGRDVITDFTTGSKGDLLDISDIVFGYQQGTSVISDFVQIVQSGGNSILRVDYNGTAGGSVFEDVFVLSGVTTTVNDLVANGNLVLT